MLHRSIKGSNLAVTLTKHLSSLIGSVVALAGTLPMLASKSVKTWVESHNYLIFITLVITLAAAFVIIDFILNRKRDQVTEHDRKIVANLLSTLPPNTRDFRCLNFVPVI
jgi:hypothetical protein